MRTLLEIAKPVCGLSSAVVASRGIEPVFGLTRLFLKDELLAAFEDQRTRRINRIFAAASSIEACRLVSRMPYIRDLQ